MRVIESIMKHEMAEAIRQKRACRIDDENAFAMRVSIVGPGGQVAEVPFMQWKNRDEKRLKMHILSALCKKVSATAALVVSDARYIVPEAFCEHFKLPFPQTETFWDDYQRVMADFDYDMENLPRQLWEEALMVVAYGPRVTKMMMAKYSVVNRVYVFEPSEMMPGGDHGKTQVEMIPAWWH
jgi:hypothetical protein